MPASPKRSGKTARGDSRFLSEVLAANLAREREIQGLTQEEVAERMRQLGHEWVRATVSEVERLGRLVSVEELGGLGLVFGTTILRLLSAPGEMDDPPAVDHGGPQPIPPLLEYLWLHDYVTFIWEWDGGLPARPMLGVRLTEEGRYVKRGGGSNSAIEYLWELQEGDLQLRKQQKRLEEAFVDMGMAPPAARAVARGRKQPALFYLIADDVESRTTDFLIWQDDLESQPFVELPDEEARGEDDGEM